MATERKKQKDRERMQRKRAGDKEVAQLMLVALKAIVEDMSHFPEVSESIFHSLNLADEAIEKAERKGRE